MSKRAGAFAVNAACLLIVLGFCALLGARHGLDAGVASALLVVLAYGAGAARAT